MSVDSATHYDRVTDVWKEFMGHDLHFGYFESEEMELAEAADRLIDKMLELCDIHGETRMLDVGCGIGGPAFYIHERYGCEIHGISTSRRGIQLAREAALKRGLGRVHFHVADGMDNGFPDRSFDLVWIMESSHPIPDKGALFRECRRVLKDDGTLVMCDLVQVGSLPFLRGLRYLAGNLREFFSRVDVWGPAQILSPDALRELLQDSGFRDIQTWDISEKVIPTLHRWRANALRFLESERGKRERRYAKAFARACQKLERAFQDGLMGYALLRARP